MTLSPPSAARSLPPWWRRLSPVFVVVAALWATLSTAHATQSPTKIYFDAQTGRFNAPITTGNDGDIEIFTILPQGSEPEFAYWPKKKKDVCDPAAVDPPGYRVTAALAVPGAESGKQRFVAHLGPLRLNVHYCFRLQGKRSASLSGGQQKQVRAAIASTLRTAAEWSRTDTRPFAAECAVDLSADPPPAMTRCELGKAFHNALPEKLRGLRVKVDGQELSTEAGFVAALGSTPGLQTLIADTLAGLTGARLLYPKVEAARRDLEDEIEPPLEYSPLGTLTYADLRRASKALFPAAAAVEGDALAERIWSHRDALFQAKAWTALKDSASTDLEAFLTHNQALRTTQPVFVRITQESWGALIQKIHALPARDAKANYADYGPAAELAAQERQRYPSATELAALPGWASASDAPKISQYLELVGTLANDAQAIADVEARAQAIDPTGSVTPAPEITLFTNAMVEVTSFRALNVLAVDTDFNDRFPMYVSADVGIAAAALPIKGSDGEGFGGIRGEAVAYFGLNIYTTAIDKDEPVNRCRGCDRTVPDDNRLRNFRRRFAFTAAFSVLRPSLNRNLGVEGLLGKQVLLAGAGYRITDYFRVGGGAMLYRQTSPNPLSDKTTFRAAPYLSVSIDADVVGTIRGWFNKSKVTN